MSAGVFATALAVVLLIGVLGLLWRRQVSEKYAATWLIVTALVVVLAVFPRLAFWLADLVGVETPVNLVFALAIVMLVLVSVSLSVGLTSAEAKIRTLAEEVALLRRDVAELADDAAARRGDDVGGSPGPN